MWATTVPITSEEQNEHYTGVLHELVMRGNLSQKESGTTDYTIRQPKPSEQAIIPLNTAIEFKLDKNKMKFKVDGKSFEFMVISQAAASSPDAAPASSAPNHQ
jgi:hypothetical protein